MTPTGDMTFGAGTGNFIVNTPEAVAQLAVTRMNLWTNQWFLNLEDGTPYGTQILGKHTQSLYDNAITQRLLGTVGVESLAAYQSHLDRATRQLTYSATLATFFGKTQLAGTLSVPA